LKVFDKDFRQVYPVMKNNGTSKGRHRVVVVKKYFCSRENVSR